MQDFEKYQVIEDKLNEITSDYAVKLDHFDELYNEKKNILDLKNKSLLDEISYLKEQKSKLEISNAKLEKSNTKFEENNSILVKQLEKNAEIIEQLTAENKRLEDENKALKMTAKEV